jgi:hypothetical protein
VDAVGREGQAEEPGRRAVLVVTRVPEAVGSVLEQDSAPLADLAVPGVVAGSLKDRIPGARLPIDEGPGGVIGDNGSRREEEKNERETTHGMVSEPESGKRQPVVFMAPGRLTPTIT